MTYYRNPGVDDDVYDEVRTTSFSTKSSNEYKNGSQFNSYETTDNKPKMPEESFEDGRSSFKKNSINEGFIIPKPYAGMPKEVLLHYSRQPQYVWARNILAIIVILAILTLLSLVIAIIAISPACLEFWQTSPVYQIYPKSFKNSNNDSYGDLQGIIEKLDYINDELGIKTIWLNPVYASPQADGGYDIKDFRDIDPIFGSMTDMEDLIAEMHNRGMKLLMDFIPNHTSEEHDWFIASSNPSNESYDKYKDYYVWVDGEEGVLPNNWQSEFLTEDSPWKWNDKRNQYYFHAFYHQQPDLNLNNPVVLEELKDILRFWLEKGVDGFRCDAVGYGLEASHLRDNPVIDATKNLTKDNIYPDYTQNYKGIHDIVAGWRSVLDEYSTEPGVYRFMETEVYADTPTVVRYYGTELLDEADFPMNFLLVDADPVTDWNAINMELLVLEWMTNMPVGRWPNWVISNHDNSRLPSRVGDDLAESAAFMVMTLPGTAGMYYGDEIGMTDNYNVDPSGDFRDPERTPMQWSTDKNAGFCDDCEPWLPVNENYMEINVETELQNDLSMLGTYKKLINLRTALTFQRGWFCMLESTSNVLMYVRELEGLESYMVLINFDQTGSNTIPKHISMTSDYPNLDGATGKVVMDSKTTYSSEVTFDNISLYPGQSQIIKFSISSSKMFSKQSELTERCFISSNVCYNNGLKVLQVC